MTRLLGAKDDKAMEEVCKGMGASTYAGLYLLSSASPSMTTNASYLAGADTVSWRETMTSPGF